MLGAYCNLVVGVGNRGVGVHRGMDVVIAAQIVCLAGLMMMTEEVVADNAGPRGTWALVGLRRWVGEGGGVLGSVWVAIAVQIVCLAGSMMAEETEADDAGPPGTRALVGLKFWVGEDCGVPGPA